MSDPTEHFRLAIAAAGLESPDAIHADGKIHRFSTNGRHGDDSGWYLLHLDGIPAGTFGCWRQGLTQTWCSKSDDTMTHAERETHGRRKKAMKAQRDAEHAQRQRQHQARETAAAPGHAATPAADHPYLDRKGSIQAHGARIEGEALLIPLRDGAGILQTIVPDGDKRLMFDGRVSGCNHAIGKPAGVLMVCEGFATDAIIHEATGYAMAVAFKSGNLRSVAQALHAKYPALKIIIAGDEDWQTPGNLGLNKATEAARAMGGWLAVHKFPTDRPDKTTGAVQKAHVVVFNFVRTSNPRCPCVLLALIASCGSQVEDYLRSCGLVPWKPSFASESERLIAEHVRAHKLVLYDEMKAKLLRDKPNASDLDFAVLRKEIRL